MIGREDERPRAAQRVERAQVEAACAHRLQRTEVEAKAARDQPAPQPPADPAWQQHAEGQRHRAPRETAQAE